MKIVEYINKQNSVNKSKHKTSKNIFHHKSNHNHLYKTCYSGELGFKTNFINLSDIKYEEIG